MNKPKTSKQTLAAPAPGYELLLGNISDLIAAARRSSARAVNVIITATYWDIGRQIIEFEQGGKTRAHYGEELLARLSHDLTSRHGRGFGVDNLELFRKLYVAFPPSAIRAKLSLQPNAPKPTRTLQNSESPARNANIPSISESLIRNLSLPEIAAAFPLSYAHKGENPPVGLILCTEKDEAVAKYALDALPNKVLAREYQLALPGEKALVAELERTRKQLEARRK